MTDPSRTPPRPPNISEILRRRVRYSSNRWPCLFDSFHNTSVKNFVYFLVTPPLFPPPLSPSFGNMFGKKMQLPPATQAFVGWNVFVLKPVWSGASMPSKKLWRRERSVSHVVASGKQWIDWGTWQTSIKPSWWWGQNYHPSEIKKWLTSRIEYNPFEICLCTSTSSIE